VAPGFSLHDEFQALSHAGLSNQRILESTTRRAAEWLGTLGDRGTVGNRQTRGSRAASMRTARRHRQHAQDRGVICQRPLSTARGARPADAALAARNAGG